MSRASMDRRAFLLLRTRGRERVMELSCERLYMRWADARSRGTRAIDGVMPGGGEWEGEPPAHIEAEAESDLWAELDHGLASSDVVVVQAREWLADSTFVAQVEVRLSDFVERGGRVE